MMDKTEDIVKRKCKEAFAITKKGSSATTSYEAETPHVQLPTRTKSRVEAVAAALMQLSTASPKWP